MILQIRITRFERGYWVVYYTSHQNFIFAFSYWLAWQLWGLSCNQFMIGLFIKLSVQMFQPLIVIYKRGNIVYHHWGCAFIHRLLSYPFRSLKLYPIPAKLFYFCILRVILRIRNFNFLLMRFLIQLVVVHNNRFLGIVSFVTSPLKGRSVVFSQQLLIGYFRLEQGLEIGKRLL